MSRKEGLSLSCILMDYVVIDVDWPHEPQAWVQVTGPPVPAQLLHFPNIKDLTFMLRIIVVLMDSSCFQELSELSLFPL